MLIVHLEHSYIGIIARKPVLGVPEKVRFNQVCSNTDTLHNIDV